ncbi:MAG: arginine--tRNA ligase [Candidatus Saganbacteria bacterium]|nr:arginine--tRNA ligase [Candidatus Saganbacteria bacterium]
MKERIRLELENALKKSALFFAEIPLAIEVPQNPKHGDYSTNYALLAAKQQKKNPHDVALIIVDALNKHSSNLFSKIEVVKPGFINFFIDDRMFFSEIALILYQKDGYGEGDAFLNQKILLEFVSANPTGPLHIGHGRWAVLGDNLARLLLSQGGKVETEFYVNNVGKQIEMLMASVGAAIEGQPIPENGYHGNYIKELAEKAKEEKPASLLDFVLAEMIGSQKQILSLLGVDFNRWFSEKDLHDSGAVKDAVAQLEKKEATFKEGGAVWFKSEDYGDDKNRVLIREDGVPTYFAADIAYHLDKLNRGYDSLINIWGTDHHGYVARLKAALQALGFDQNKLKIIIGQLVSLYRGEEQVRMSKRTGDMITLLEVVEEIGCDATRFFMSMTNEHTHLDFDLELAKQKSDENPVFYVQYAHARICSILRQEDLRRPASLDYAAIQFSLLSNDAEKNLIKKLCAFPDVLKEAALAYEPHRLTVYVREVATLFHNFYHQCRVISDDLETTKARLVLIEAARIVIKNVLKLLNISAPERM